MESEYTGFFPTFAKISVLSSSVIFIRLAPNRLPPWNKPRGIPGGGASESFCGEACCSNRLYCEPGAGRGFDLLKPRAVLGVIGTVRGLLNIDYTNHVKYDDMQMII